MRIDPWLRKRRSACSAPPAIPARSWCACCCGIRARRSCCSPPSAAPARRCARCSRSSRRSSCRRSSPSRGIDWARRGLDVAFCALPHATTQKVIKELLAKAPATKVVDLSADFRLADPAAYAKWYGHEHHAPELQKEAVYGLTEIHRRDDQAGAAGRQSGLLHILRAAAADPADQGQGDRARRDRGRRQVGHDRRGQGGQGGHAVLGSVGGLPRLWRRPSPAHGRARPGVFARRRARGDRHLHAASGADEPGHSLDHLCAGPARADAARTFMRYF